MSPDQHQIRNLAHAAEADGYAGLVWAVELRHPVGRAIHLRVKMSAASLR